MFHLKGSCRCTLLPLAATISILGQPAHEHHRPFLDVDLAVSGVGAIRLEQRTADQSPERVGLLLMLVAVCSYRHHSALWPRSWWGIGTYGLGALCAALSVAADAPLSSVASLLACAVLLPLVPFHDGHLTALTRLPGSLPSFIVVLLPMAGLHQLATLCPPYRTSWPGP